MNAIFSIPLFFLPSGLVTYTTTSLNLLLFTLTWSSLLLTYPPLPLELVSSLLTRILFFLLPSLLSLAFDVLLPSLSVQIKRGGQKALPAGGGGAGRASTRRRGGGPPPWWQVLLVVMGNLVLDTLVQGGVELFLTEVLRVRSAVRVHKTIPLPGEIVKDILRSFFAREALQYTLHRYALHASSPSRSRRAQTFLLRLHTTWSHSLPTPYCLTANYDHPLPHLLHTTLPPPLPLLLFRPHLLTTLLYLALTSLDDVSAHSGYTILPSLLLSGAARRVDAHHTSGGAGNFSKWGVFDWVGGTAVRGTGVDRDVRREWAKHDGEQKLEGVRQAGRDLRSSARRKSARRRES